MTTRHDDPELVATEVLVVERGATLRIRAAELAVSSGPDAGRTVRIEQPTFVVGSGPGADLRLTDPAVSQEHLRLSLGPDGMHLRDGGSKNGTWIGAIRVADITLVGAATVQIGRTVLSLQLDASAIDLPLSDAPSFGGAIAVSTSMRHLFALLERAAASDVTVLLEGESGVGKEVLATAIHARSARESGPFVAVDCGAIPANLIESELFGHERGAFTGAVASRQGAFELADGGTVFLDEIGELPLDVQPKLLRVLETKEFRRVGGNKPMRSNVRVIAATKRNLLREVQAGKFREDLYFRLAVVPVTVPPLRARREDIPLLARHILKLTAAGGIEHSLSNETLDAMMAHDWPGNVRELRNVLERAVYLAQATGSSELGLVMVPQTGGTAEGAFQFDAGKSYRETRTRFESEFEKRYVKWLLGRHGGNVSAAARDAKMDRKHLHDIAKKHGLRGTDHDD